MFTKIILFLSLIAITLSAPLKEKRKREIIVDRTRFYLNSSAKYYTTEPSQLFDLGRPVAIQWLNLLQRPFNVVQHPFNDQILKQMPEYQPKLNYKYNKPSKQVLLVNRLTKDNSTTEPSELFDIGGSIANSRLDTLQRRFNGVQQQFAALKLKQVPIYQPQLNYEYNQQPKQEPSVKRLTKDNSTTKPSKVFDLAGPLANPWLNPYTFFDDFRRTSNDLFAALRPEKVPIYLPKPNYEYNQQPKQEPSVKQMTKYKSKTEPSEVFDLGGPLANPWLNPYTHPLHRPFKRIQNQFNDQKPGQFPFYLPNY